MPRYPGNRLVLGNPSGHRPLGPVALSPAERARHLYVVGATRTGKSKLLEDCVRQDVLAWPRSGCGLLVLDRHGSLYDALVRWAASLDLGCWPIVPIDLRRDDWVVSYNPLRRRSAGEDAAVVVGNFVRSILHAWGQSSLSDTPRLVKWLEAILLLLHEQGFTLAEALQVIASPGVRAALTDRVRDLVLKSVWDTAPSREAEFQEVVESTVNRVRRFLSRRVMRATLGQPDVSLDLGVALEAGQILLVALATEGGKIDEEDASTLGSLLLSDLWMAAKCRGKRDEGRVKPFYVYLDEFQEYVTPAMADTLDQASGFGLHMTLAHQFPSQLLRGEEGKRLYQSVMANCRSKVVFQLEHNQDVQDLALMLYRGRVDPMRVKHELHTTKVLGHDLRYLPNRGTSQTVTDGGGTQHTHTDGRNHTVGTNRSHTDAENEAYTLTEGMSEALTLGVGENESDTEGTSAGYALSEDVTEDEDPSDEEESEPPERTATLSEGVNASRTQGRNWSASLQAGRNESQAYTAGTSSADTYGDSEAHGTSASDAVGTNTNWSKGQTTSVNYSPVLVPRMGSELSGVMFAGIDEQLFGFAQQLATQPDRHCVAKVVGRPPHPARYPDRAAGADDRRLGGGVGHGHGSVAPFRPADGRGPGDDRRPAPGADGPVVHRRRAADRPAKNPVAPGCGTM